MLHTGPRSIRLKQQFSGLDTFHGNYISFKKGEYHGRKFYNTKDFETASFRFHDVRYGQLLLL